MSAKKYSTDRETLETECEVEFIKAGGPGGQHRNKRETGARISHPPSGVIVTAVERRSQVQNLEAAFERLINRLRSLNVVPKKRKRTRIPRRVIEKRLEGKRRRSQTKARRGRVDPE